MKGGRLGQMGQSEERLEKEMVGERGYGKQKGWRIKSKCENVQQTLHESYWEHQGGVATNKRHIKVNMLYALFSLLSFYSENVIFFSVSIYIVNFILLIKL